MTVPHFLCTASEQIVNKLNDALTKVVQDAEFKEKCESLFTLIPMRGDR